MGNSGERSGKVGRSVMVLGPIDLFDDRSLTRKKPSSLERQGMATPEEFARGLVFIDVRSVANVSRALKATGVTVSETAPVVLQPEKVGRIFYCVVSERAFDQVFDALRETCVANSAAGVVLFGEASLPGKTPLFGLARTSRISKISLGDKPMQINKSTVWDTDQWLEITDLARVRFGEDCPDVGAAFPQVIRLRVQTVSLN